METLYFRADMNKEIATGHIMRCLSIADAAKKMGIECGFILADDNAVDLINGRGHRCIVLNSDWKNKDEELPDLLKTIEEYQISRLIIDSYQVTYNYLEKLTQVTDTTYIDDVNAFKYPVNNIICYANYYKKFDYSSYQQQGEKYQSKKLLGCQYVPLRQEFVGMPSKHNMENVKDILLMSGGSDQYHILQRLLNEIASQNRYNITVVCGRYNSDYENMKSQYAGNPRIKIYQSVNNLIDYLKAADVAVSAGGSTLYELCACGTPTITYSFADNQKNNVEQFDEDGIMRYAGDVRYDDIIKNICESIELYGPHDYREQISKNMQLLVDGKGAERIVEMLYNI